MSFVNQVKISDKQQLNISLLYNNLFYEEIRKMKPILKIKRYIKQKINNTLSFDAGYMRIFQQKNNGSTYSLSDVYRLFFYYTLPPKNQSNTKHTK